MDTANPFVELVAGVVWLVRNGMNVVSQSRDVEFAGVEETGTMYQFISVMSGRSAVGFDNSGVAYLVQVDGRTGQRG
jgi:N-acetylglucosamine-1-phosphodiester alpha-N-acetylglucosaminidase